MSRRATILAATVTAAVVAVIAVVVTATVTRGSDDKTTGNHHNKPSHSAPSDPYAQTPWRLAVVNFLKAANHPQDDKYRTWLPLDPDIHKDFIYTPRTPADPGYNDRTEDDPHGALVNLSDLTPTKQRAVLNSLTRDSTVIPDSLTVTQPNGRDSGGWSFTFTIRTTGGKQLHGMAIGSGDANGGQLRRLSYDTP
ncbi:hypothetical protein [Wenjunlia tyrosinilytica]|uniref:Uncharacterized protein n=1 Tax=Wenjunlia tyrosinilytica TaxID=1544741 RepID=A0A917ZVU1_9ACTN|nr:hypothetical protein [Wenjunlia tyrosinilytica]GGO98096.1 hypothetical protein GCM10012280_61430 [Wenjunlia tyrosinilytica]